MSIERESQIYRVLSMYERLINGEKIVKREEAIRFQTSEKSIQRDLRSIRNFLEIEQFKQKCAQFKVSYEERFQEGEFRKRVQFMYPGELITVKFKFTGPSPQAVLDRLPTAKIVERFYGGVVFEAEVFGKGVKMWLLCHGEHVEVLEPKDFRDEFADVIHKMAKKCDSSFIDN